MQLNLQLQMGIRKKTHYSAAMTNFNKAQRKKAKVLEKPVISPIPRVKAVPVSPCGSPKCINKCGYPEDCTLRT